MVFVMGVAQSECSKQTKMKHENERMEPKHASPVACLSKTGKLITSLHDDVRTIQKET